MYGCRGICDNDSGCGAVVRYKVRGENRGKKGASLEAHAVHPCADGWICAVFGPSADASSVLRDCTPYMSATIIVARSKPRTLLFQSPTKVPPYDGGVCDGDDEEHD